MRLVDLRAMKKSTKRDKGIRIDSDHQTITFYCHLTRTNYIQTRVR